MSRHRRARRGDGTVWLVADRARGGLHCYWYVGPQDDRLAEHATALDVDEALAWGRRRTPSVRMRTADARTVWAGAGTRPAGFTETWNDPLEAPSG